MATATTERDSKTLADALDAIGDVPLDRIRFPVGQATEDDLIRLLDGDDKRLCELIEGILVEKAMGVRESILASAIAAALRAFVDPRDLGVVFATDGPFRLRPGRIRLPDAGFVSWERFPDGVVPDEPICDAVPDLAVEVISDSNTTSEMEIKVREYFAAGVRIVWYVYPKTRSAIAFTSPTRRKTIAPHGSLDGGKVLPGFSLELVDVFAALKRRKRS